MLALQHEHAAAEIPPSHAAIIAVAALARRIDHHTLSDDGDLHSVACGHDLAGNLMSQDERRCHGKIAKTPFLEVMHIRPADAGAANPQQDLPRTGLGAGRSSTRRSRMPCRTAAFMVVIALAFLRIPNLVKPW